MAVEMKRERRSRWVLDFLFHHSEREPDLW